MKKTFFILLIFPAVLFAAPDPEAGNFSFCQYYCTELQKVNDVCCEGTYCADLYTSCINTMDQYSCWYWLAHAEFTCEYFLKYLGASCNKDYHSVIEIYPTYNLLNLPIKLFENKRMETKSSLGEYLNLRISLRGRS